MTRRGGSRPRPVSQVQAAGARPRRSPARAPWSLFRRGTRLSSKAQCWDSVGTRLRGAGEGVSGAEPHAPTSAASASRNRSPYNIFFFNWKGENIKYKPKSFSTFLNKSPLGLQWSGRRVQVPALPGA